MKLTENKLILTEAELDLIKKASRIASPSMAGLTLHRSLAGIGSDHDVNECVKAVLAYRGKNFEIE